MQYLAAFLPEVFYRCSLSWIKVSAAGRAGCPVNADICLAAPFLFVFFFPPLLFAPPLQTKSCEDLTPTFFVVRIKVYARDDKGLRS